MGSLVSRLTQYAGGRPPATTSIVNEYSSGGVSTNNLALSVQGKLASSGSGTGGTLATLLNVSGAGYVPYLICFSNSATPTHTIRCQVIVDGTTIFDATSDSIATTQYRGMSIVDCIPQSSTYSDPTGVAIRFNTSFVVKACSSQSGTDYVAIRYEYHTTAY